MESKKKKIQMKLFRSRNRLTNFENKPVITKGERWREGINLEFGINIYIPLYIK